MRSNWPCGTASRRDRLMVTPPPRADPRPSRRFRRTTRAASNRPLIQCQPSPRHSGHGRDPVLGRRCLSCRFSLQDCEPRRLAPAVHVQPASRVRLDRQCSLVLQVSGPEHRSGAHPDGAPRIRHREAAPIERNEAQRDGTGVRGSPRQATKRTPPLRPRPPAGRERRERGKRASSRAGSGRRGPESHRRTSPPPTVGALHREHREVLNRPPAPRSRRAPPGLHPERAGVEACAGAAYSPSRRLRYASPAVGVPGGSLGRDTGAGAESAPFPLVPRFSNR